MIEEQTVELISSEASIEVYEGPVCPDCGTELNFTGRCGSCPNCGYSMCSI